MSKKLKYIFLFLLLIFFIFIGTVQADTISADPYLYRKVEHETSGGLHSFSYTVYLNTGKFENTIYMSEELYNNNFWLITISETGIPKLLVNTNDVDTCTFYANASRINSGVEWTFDVNDSYLKGYNFYDYDFNSNSFKLVSSGQGIWCYPLASIQPNSIIFTHNMSVVYYLDEDHKCPLGSLQDLPRVTVPELGYMPDEGFRLYLNGFAPLTDITDSYEVSSSIINLSFNVHSSNRNMDVVTSSDLLSYRDVEIDDRGRYYVDILFEDYSTFIDTSTDDDYILSFNITIERYKHLYRFGDSTRFDTTTRFPLTNYLYRYRYFADSGVGLLIPVDENGNEIVYNNSDDNGNENSNGNEENNQEYFSELNSTISDNTNAINTQTTKIEEQTNAIESMHETSRGILQTIIDLPGNLVNLFLNMLKSLFIPSDDFFTNWLDDLNTYFGDTFGILYYPFELLINFLNKISSINDTNTAIIHIPAFSLMGETFINEYSYNLNDLLQNETFNNIHTIYLTIVDMILWLGVVFLAAKCIKTFIGGMSGEVLSNISINNKGGEE